MTSANIALLGLLLIAFMFIYFLMVQNGNLQNRLMYYERHIMDRLKNMDKFLEIKEKEDSL